MARPGIAIALPTEEAAPVAAELRAAGFTSVTIQHPDELEALLDNRNDIAVAILDGETDFDQSLEYYGLLRENGRAIPALMVVSPRALDRLTANPTASSADDEYLTRPYSAESLRWRVEAMCIRSQTVDDGSGPVLQSGIDTDSWARRATVIAVFNPKGGVGKTTVATNLASALQVRRSQNVLLIDADTVTGHVSTSLGLDEVRTVVDSWRDELEGGPVETLVEMASAHPSGMRVVSLTSSPLHTEILDPKRIADAIEVARRGFDFVVVDLHPSYGPLNQAIFEKADRILVPVTPDVPAIRAAVQLSGVASELAIRERLALVINRANSGISIADMERTVGMPALALIRSGGLLFVRAANEGRTVIEMFPKEKITEDFDALADRLLGTPVTVPAPKMGFGIFNRQKAPVRA
ncbi:MAG TPA: AAA family ATPase [Candidatus Saccharimonadales bacterium]|nr:AAA family ATPase [Candidatus Saccharimonadales bacterium]